MPYFPPDVSPPPIVHTVQTPSTSAVAFNHWEETAPAEAEKRSSHKVLAPAVSLENTEIRLTSTPQSRSSALGSAPINHTNRPFRAVVPASEDTDEAETTLPHLSSPWVSQSHGTNDNTSVEEAPIAPSPTETESTSPTENDGIADNADDEGPTFPRAATPEPFWSNGAVMGDGVLLLPSQPTNRPPSPLDLTADYQEFEPLTQILTARGNVVLRLSNGILSADRLWANLANRYVVVEGTVIFTRGEQTVEAEQGEYNLIQGQGSLFQARGSLFLPGVATDFGDIGADGVRTTPGVLETDPISNVRGTGNITFGTGVQANQEELPTPDAGGFVRRIRFEAEQLDFDAEGWYAQEIRLTNDPFSPPELEFRGDSARLTRLNEFQDELFVENARIVFDQGFAVPLFRNTLLLDRGGPDNANPLFVTVGFDGEDRDGLFVERSFRVATTGQWEFFLTPQFLAQRFVNSEDDGFLSNFGLEADLRGALGPTTTVDANASFAGLDLDNLDDRLRSSVRVQQALGSHSLNLEYSYRDRLFNGSLGFQDVQSSLGLVLISPRIVLGNTGIGLTYQTSAQYITSDTDRPELLDPPATEDLVSLGRFQASVALSRGFLLWRGEPLPATRDEGLRFTSVPRTPNVQLVVGGRGTYTYYTSNDTQESLSASVGISGELGHFSRDFLDSTVFNLTYQRSFTGEEGNSPFLFDRDVDQNVLSGGLIQQIYGPFRLGVQTSINLDTGEVINTDYLLEYNRRTYGIFLRFNPTQSAGFLGFRLNEFDWSGRAPRFGGADIRPVEGGVVR